MTLMQVNLRIWILPLVLLGACLEADPDDVVDPSSRFGDPSLSGPEAALHIESEAAQALDPTRTRKLDLFPGRVAYLRGFAEGQPIRYFNVEGPNADFIAPMYEVIGPDDKRIGRRIIDVIPGDTGYTPWWRLTKVRTTAKFDALDPMARPRIWSRDAIDAGLTLGYLQAPEPTTQVYDCPVLKAGTKIRVDDGPDDLVGTDWVWYRNLHVDWACFSGTKEVPTDRRQMPVYPVHVLQRIDEPLPIYELAIGADLDGDGLLVNSNNIFPNTVGGERYSPFWFVALVRTEANYISIDTSSTAVGLSAEDQFLRLDAEDPDDLAKATVISSQVKSVEAFPDQWVNCPLQTTRGAL